MTRTTRRNSEKKLEDKNIIKKDELQRKIFLINNPLKTTPHLIFYTLRHPGTERKSYFYLSTETKQIFQLIQIKEPNRSFFIDENISSNGIFYITIPFDVTFLMLYYIRKCCDTNAIPIDHIHDPDYPELSKLLIEFANEELLQKISDVKKSGESLYFKYNKNKSLAWLSVKTKRLSEQLLNNKTTPIGNNSSVSSNYNKSETLHQVNKIEYLQQACDIIGTFITKDLKMQLMGYLSITDVHNSKAKRKSTALDQQNNKKFKSENNEGNSMHSPPLKKTVKKEKGPSNKDLKLAKAASGTKSISSFFSKK